MSGERVRRSWDNRSVGSGQSRLGIKGLYATGAAPWALRERRAAGAAWGGGDAPGEAAWVGAGLKGAFKAPHSVRLMD